MTSINATSLGVFKTGEVPVDLSVRFDDSTGTQIDISTGYTAVAYWRNRNADPSTAQALTATISTATNPLGLAVVDMTAAVVATVGVYVMEVWVGTATNEPKLASQTFTYQVIAAVTDTAPTFPV